ncbi:MAG: RDD family protein [Opitutaceae bacterium]|nr:RDD family protein [Opitutaceae bacterium]
MPAPAGEADVSSGRVVTPAALSVAPGVVGRPLAEPWRRLAAMAVDIGVVGLLSLLSTPLLGLGTGLMLCVLLGNAAGAPLALKLARWACRLLGVGIIGLSALALGHTSLLKSRGLDLEVLAGRAEHPAREQTVYVPPEPTTTELRVATRQLQQQVQALKEELDNRDRAGSSWIYQVRSFTGAMGVTFGWSGIYFTLIAGIWRGRTVGKFIFRTRAINLDGRELTFFDAFVRHGGYVAGVAMGLLGFFRLLWEPNRQAVEDRIAGTVVVRD